MEEKLKPPFCSVRKKSDVTKNENGPHEATQKSKTVFAGVT